jgi:hypothetical protein
MYLFLPLGETKRMWKRIIGLMVLLGVGYLGYDYYKAGYHTRPELPEGAFSLSFKGGLRGIVVGLENVEPERVYIAYGARQVPNWYQKSWSTCRALTTEELAQLHKSSVDLGPGGRWEAVCEIDADGDVFVRGWLASVPDV